MLTFNQSTSRVCVDIPIQDDDTSEDPEDLRVFLTSEDPDVSSTRPEANVTIVDDDEVTIGFEREQYSIGEDQGNVEVCVEVREGSLEREIVITLLTQDSSSAVTPQDYMNISVELTFDPNSSIQCVNISIVNDDILEGVEDIEILLVSGNEERVNLSPERATVQITDDDGNAKKLTKLHIQSLYFL